MTAAGPGELAVRRVVVGPLATNCWIPHTATGSALVIDPGDDPAAILGACADLRVKAVVLTHTHWDHVLALPALTGALDVPVLAHPAEAPVWRGELDHLREHGHWDAGTAPVLVGPDPGAPLWDGRFDPVGDGTGLDLDGHTVTLTHTPGHTPGGLTAIIGEHLFTGDTLFPGGPGLTGWPLSDFPTIIASVERLLATHPATATVHPGHGRDTTVGAERPAVPAWRRRGW